MDPRLANTWRMTIDNKKFIETALLNDLRVDGRRPFDYRQLTVKFGREDGSSEIQLGQTRVMAYVTSQLVQPYRDRPNEGTFSIFTEFSPMADPSFEVGRPGESAVELGRVIDRGLRESRAVDMESLAVIAGKYVWAIRLDLHILDNGGNLFDAANIAALAALMTFRRPECTVVGEDGQEVQVHPPEVREPLPLLIHHIPVAVTFAFFSEGTFMVIDPTYEEEAVMGGRMTVTINSNGEICAIQKAGGEGVTSNVIMQCLRIASTKVADIKSKIESTVDAYNLERTQRKVKRHLSVSALEVNVQNVSMWEGHSNEVAGHRIEESKDDLDKIHRGGGSADSRNVKAFIGRPSNWDPYSKGASSDLLQHPVLLAGSLNVHREQVVETAQKQEVFYSEESTVKLDGVSTVPVEVPSITPLAKSPRSLRDAIKTKNRRKKKGAVANDK